MTQFPLSRVLHLAAILCVALLVAANLMLIFSFSSESRGESASRSRNVTIAVARLLDPSFDDMSPVEQNAVVDELHHYVRKAAHFLEFALLGFLTAVLTVLVWRFFDPHPILWLTLCIPASFCLLSAVTDEVYQIFTGRGPAVKDMMIDFCGAVSGVLFLHLAVWLIGKIHCARKREAGEREDASV